MQQTLVIRLLSTLLLGRGKEVCFRSAGKSCCVGGGGGVFVNKRFDVELPLATLVIHVPTVEVQRV